MSLGVLTKLSGLGARVITKLPAPVSGAIGKVSLAATANSPLIFAVGGGLLAIGAVIEAARSTPKFMEDLEECNKMLEEQKLYKERKDKIAAGEIIPDDPNEYKPYTKSDSQKDRMSIYAKIVVAGIKRYGKSALLLAGSFTCFGMALKILNGWLAGATAALAMTQDELEHLEQNVEREYGAEVLERLKGPNKDETIVDSHVDENGETVVDKVTEVSHNRFEYLFDESNPNWTKDPVKNRLFIEQVERFLNDLLSARGYLFLNEALRALGFEWTKTGQIYGWLKDKNDPKTANNHIRIKLQEGGNRFAYDPETHGYSDLHERSFWIELNVDKESIIERCSMLAY